MLFLEDFALKRKIIQQVEEDQHSNAIPIADIAAPGEEVKWSENIVGMHCKDWQSPHEDRGSELSKTNQCQFHQIRWQELTTTRDHRHVVLWFDRKSIIYKCHHTAGHKEGVPLDKLDKAMKKFDMPVGPIILINIGVDVIVSKVANYLSPLLILAREWKVPISPWWRIWLRREMKELHAKQNTIVLFPSKLQV